MSQISFSKPPQIPLASGGLKMMVSDEGEDFMLNLMLTAAMNVQGTWFKPCEETSNQSFIRQELQVMDGQWIREARFNIEHDCKGKDFLATRQIFKADTEEPRLDLETVAVYYEPLTDETAALLNTTQYCGVTNWRRHIPKEVTGHNCGGTQIPEKGHKIFSIYRLQPRDPRDLLWVGETAQEADGSTPENRHLTFELYAFERSRQPSRK